MYFVQLGSNKSAIMEPRKDGLNLVQTDKVGLESLLDHGMSLLLTERSGPTNPGRMQHNASQKTVQLRYRKLAL